MRAISNYLLIVGELDDAFNEIEELLKVEPYWFMSINQKGFYYGSRGDPRQAVLYYSQVALLRPRHFIGNFNLACCHSLLGNLDEAIRHLRLIVTNEDATKSARETLDSLYDDPDFANVIASGAHAAEFSTIEKAIFPGSDRSPLTSHDDSHYTY
jgi:tetratricopeptide (TPR) repeat protein